MKSSTIYTIALLLFLVVSIGYFAYKESRAQHVIVDGKNRDTVSQTGDSSKTTSGKENNPDAVSQGGQSNTSPLSVIPPGVSSSKVIVYYFHGNKRCANCIKIENYSREAVEIGFADALKKGDIIWKVVNTDEPENEHFVKDYQLSTKSVVLVRMRDGHQEQWKNLQEVWNHLNDKEGFIKYVQAEVQKYIE
jgi:hypothetical protein